MNRADNPPLQTRPAPCRRRAAAALGRRTLGGWLMLHALLAVWACEICDEGAPIPIEEGKYRFDAALHDPLNGEPTPGLRAEITADGATLTFPSGDRTVVVVLEPLR